MQDNDPKHTSRVAQQFYMDSDINWWKTPAESPDMNPIENLWREPTCPLKRGLFKFLSKQEVQITEDAHYELT